jgi:hypothetical protein
MNIRAYYVLCRALDTTPWSFHKQAHKPTHQAHTKEVGQNVYSALRPAFILHQAGLRKERTCETPCLAPRASEPTSPISNLHLVGGPPELSEKTSAAAIQSGYLDHSVIRMG